MMEKNDNVTKALAVLRYQLDRYYLYHYDYAELNK